MASNLYFYFSCTFLFRFMSKNIFDGLIDGFFTTFLFSYLFCCAFCSVANLGRSLELKVASSGYCYLSSSKSSSPQRTLSSVSSIEIYTCFFSFIGLDSYCCYNLSWCSFYSSSSFILSISSVVKTSLKFSINLLSD